MKVFGLQGGLYRLARLSWRQKIHDDPDVQLRLRGCGAAARRALPGIPV